MKSSKSSSHSVNGCEIVSSTYKYQQGKMMDNNLEMINDIIRIWWKCHGMPSVLQVCVNQFPPPPSFWAQPLFLEFF